MRRTSLVSIILLSTFVAASEATGRAATCAISPCYIQDLGGPRTPKNCHEDEADVYYETRLSKPPGFTPAFCANRADDGTDPSGRAQLMIAASPDILGGFSKLCIARAMQKSWAIAGTMTYCSSPGSTLNLDDRPSHCPTPRLVNFLHGWLNAGIQCVNPLNFNKNGFDHLKISSEIILAIIAHESRFNLNAASNAGKGLMQLTTPAVREFYNGKTNYHRKFWDMAKSAPACAPFREHVEQKVQVDSTGKVDADWACKMTAPESVPAHLIVGLTNLYLCRQEAEQVITSSFNLSRLLSVKTGSAARIESERQTLADDLLLACHNWGAGNMKRAFRKISRLTFKDTTELRNKLTSTSRGGGRSIIGRVGIPTFPQKVREGLAEIKRGDSQFRQRSIPRCIQ